MIELWLKIALVPLMAVSNRIRGMYGAGGIIFAGVLAAALYVITGDILAAGVCGVLYALGESVGWGRWLRCIPAIEQDVPQHVYWDSYRQPERGKLIHGLANKLARERDDYKKYVLTALYIRASIWFPPIFVALYAFGHTNELSALVGSLFVIWLFPHCYLLAYDTAKGGDGFLRMRWWPLGEVFYGVVQGACLLGVLI